MSLFSFYKKKKTYVEEKSTIVEIFIFIYDLFSGRDAC
jgi:hypothetical protein